jgi:predicted GIY-YIG superfamily endonuclease
LLVNNKTKIPQLNQSGVYKINCKDCEAVYIGQTGRSLEKRLKEHRNSIINNNKNTGIATHRIDNNHFIDSGNIQLLHNERKGKRLDLLEQYEIKKFLKTNLLTTNDQQIFINTPITDSLLRFFP